MCLWHGRSVCEGLRVTSGLSLCVSVVLQTSFYFVRNEIFNLGDGAGITHEMCNPNPFFYYSGAKGQQQVLH